MGSPVTKVVIVFLLVLGIAYAGILLLSRGKSLSDQRVSIPAATANPPSVEQLTSRLKSTVYSLATELARIHDETSAQNAMPAIEMATATVIGLKLDRLPDAHKANMIDAVKPMVGQLVKVLKEVYKIPGVQALIEPAISPLLSRLQAFANVPAD